MPSCEELACVIHMMEVERVSHMPCSLPFEAGWRLSVEDTIEVMALCGVEPSVEMGGNGCGV